MRITRWLAVVALAAVASTVAACSHFEVRCPYEPRTFQGARIAVREGIAFAEVAGTPEEIGTQVGTLFRDEIREMAATLLPRMVGERQRAEASRLEAAVPDPYRRELRATAEAAGVPYEDLLAANVVVDARCSTAAAWGDASGGRPLAIARNLDYYPANALGSATVVFLVRPAGRRPFVSIGWPGLNSVTSGMNDAGVAAMVLINLEAVGRRLLGADAPAGIPVGYRIREILEGAASGDEARRIAISSPVASDHYIVLADEREARTIYRDGDRGFAEIGGDRGVHTCTNGAVDGSTGRQEDARSRCLRHLAEEHRGRIDLACLRRMVGASYLPYINAQAMLFVPAHRTFELALGTTFSPASRGAWVEVDAGPALAGSSIEEIAVTPLPSDGQPFRHFSQGGY